MGQIQQENMPYRVVIEGGTGGTEEKKSRFIADVRPVKTEEEAQEFWDETRKKYWDAKHHCFACILGKKGDFVRCSDDGEPAGTAGRPMLEVLSGQELTDVAVVVTRYFGGTLLGTGGLIRAYTQAVQEGLKHCRTARMRYGSRLLIRADYNSLGRLQYILGRNGMKTLDTVYTDNVGIRVIVPYEKADALVREIAEATAGQARVECEESYYYVDKEEMA